ncbi:pectate lyase [Bacillus sp. MRMR6]|uniref:pectate lyase n=1 Tax=Bacillus sp. MRMR6 TaxID=1928617 RepID=UPI0009F9B2DF|nr:pectate lyase [Bacillus sp. MRMR6]
MKRKRLQFRKGLLLVTAFLLAFTPGFGFLQNERAFAAEAAPIIQDDFNALETGSVPDGYTVSGENGSITVSEVPSTEDKSLYFEDNGADTIKAVKSFAPQTDTVTAVVNFMQTVLGSTTKVLRLLDESGSNAAVHIETRSGVISYKNSDNTFTALVDYVPNTWYSIKVVADQSTGTADVYVNNELKLEDAPFHRGVTNIGSIDSYTTGSSAKSHYLDDVQVFSGFYQEDLPIKVTPEPEPEPEEPPGDGEQPPVNVGENGVYEAENAELFSAMVDNKHPGFTGTGFVDFKPTADGSSITWKVNIENAGEYTLNFRYANGSTDTRSLEIIVNGETVKEKEGFDPTGEWTAWKSNQINASLVAGENVIVIKTLGQNDGPNMDHVQIYQEFDSIFEAEDAQITAAIIDNQHPGFTGTGFVDYNPNAPGGTITWNVTNIPANGEYTLEFRYANGAADNRPAEIKVNAQVENSELAFPSTGEWTGWKTVTTKAVLKAGDNVIVATGVGLSGGANIDHLRIHNTTSSDTDMGGRKPVEVEEVSMEDLVDGIMLKKLETEGIVTQEETKLEDEVSRIEFFAGINRVFGYHSEEVYKNLDSETSVWEVSKDKWWSYVLEAAKQAGYVQADQNGAIRPDDMITRREAAVIIADVLDLVPGKSKNNKSEDSEHAVGAVVSNGYMKKGKGFGQKHTLTHEEAAFILEKMAKAANHKESEVHIVAAEAVSANLVAVMVNGRFENFDVNALTLHGATGRFKGLNPSFTNMYPIRAAVGTNKFGDTVVMYELQDSLQDGKLVKEASNLFTGNLDELKEQANNLVSWQMDHGGWTKGMESQYSRPWDGKEKRTTQFGPNGEELGSIDNNATINQIRFISEVYQQTKDEKLKQSVLKGIDFLLLMQTETGGFPQVYPKRGTTPEDSVYYSNYVTFNDNSMINVLELFDELINESYPFSENVIDDTYKQKLEQAMHKGIDYILKAQIKVEGKLTAWCAQHDPVTYAPQHARAYEHPSISGSESVGIVRFLMSRPEQTSEIRQAVHAALQWFDEVKLEGIRYVSADPNGVYFVEEEGALTWYRFYEIGTNKPIFSGRDGVIKHTIQEIEKERRDGYSWGGSYAKQLLEIAKTTGYFENHIYVEALESDTVDQYGRKIAKGELTRVEDTTEELRASSVKLVVSKDGSGDYDTVQKAIDAVPDNNTEPVEIFIKNGTYKEVVRVPANKPFISLIGESAENTILTYDNYAKKARPEGGTYGTSGSASVYLYASDFTAKNVTMENSFDESTVEGGSQAVAVYTRGDRMKFDHVRFLGNQDTLYANGGTQYFSNCYIEGDVDFIFGAARAVFDNCDIVSLDRGSSTNNGYITAASTNINDPYGFLFINSRLISEAAEGTVYLGRPWHPGGDPNAIASVVFMNCELGAHIQQEGWTDMSGFSAKDARFYEYKNEGPGVNLDRPQLTDEEAANYTVENVLKGWNPLQ